MLNPLAAQARSPGDLGDPIAFSRPADNPQGDAAQARGIPSAASASGRAAARPAGETVKARAESTPNAAAGVWFSVLRDLAGETGEALAAAEQASAKLRKRVYRVIGMADSENPPTPPAVLPILRRCAALTDAGERRFNAYGLAVECGMTWGRLQRMAEKDRGVAELVGLILPSPPSSAEDFDLDRIGKMRAEGGSLKTIARRHGLTRARLLSLARADRRLGDALGVKPPPAAEPQPPRRPLAPPDGDAPARRPRKLRTPLFSAEGLRALQEMRLLGWGAQRQAALIGRISAPELRRGCRNRSVIRHLSMPVQLDETALRAADPQLVFECARCAKKGARLSDFCELLSRPASDFIEQCARFACLRLAIVKTPVGDCDELRELLARHKTSGAVSMDAPWPPLGEEEAPFGAESLLQGEGLAPALADGGR